MSKEETLSLATKIIEEAKRRHPLPDNLTKTMVYMSEIKEAKFQDARESIITNQNLLSELISIINLFPHTEDNYHSKLKLFELSQKFHDLMPEDSEISQLQITMDHRLMGIYIKHNKFTDEELYHTLNKVLVLHTDPQVREKQLELELKSSNALCLFHTHAGSRQAKLEDIIQRFGQSIINKFLSLPSSELLISRHYINLARSILFILGFYTDLYLESHSAIHFTHAEKILNEFERIHHCDKTYLTPEHQQSVLYLMNTYNKKYQTRIDNTDFWLSFFEIRRHFAIKKESILDLTQSSSFPFPIQKTIFECLEIVKEKLGITPQTIQRATLVMQNNARTEEKFHPLVNNLVKIEQLLHTTHFVALQSELLNMPKDLIDPLDDDDFTLIFRLLNTISELGKLIPNDLESIKNIITAADLKLRFYIARQKVIHEDLKKILDEILLIRSNEREIVIFEIEMMKAIYKKCLAYVNKTIPSEKNDFVNAINALSHKIMHFFAFLFFRDPTQQPPENQYLDVVINALSTAKFLLEKLSEGARKQTVLEKVKILVDYLKKFVFSYEHPGTLTSAQRMMVHNIIFQIILKIIEKHKNLLIENVETIDFLAIAQRLLGNGNPTDTIRQVMVLLHSIQRNKTLNLTSVSIASAENKLPVVLPKVLEAALPSTASSSQVSVISSTATLPAPATSTNTLVAPGIALSALPQTAVVSSSSHKTEITAAPTHPSKKARRKLAQKKHMQSTPSPKKESPATERSTSPAPEKVLKALDEKKSELERELTRIKQNNLHTLEQNRELQKQLANTQKSMTDSQTQHKQNHRILKTQLSAAHEKIVEITQREKQHAEESCLLKSKLQKAELEIAEVTQHQKQCVRENASLKQISKINQEQIQQVTQELKTQQQAAETQAQAQAKRIAELEKQLLLTQKKAATSALEVQTLQKKVSQSEKDIQALKTEAAQSTARQLRAAVEERKNITDKIIKPLQEQLADKVAALAIIQSYQRSGIAAPQPPTQPVYALPSWRPDLFGSNPSATSSSVNRPVEQFIWTHN